MHIYIKMIQPFFSHKASPNAKCQNTETMLSLMAMAVGISEHMLTSWPSFISFDVERKWFIRGESARIS